MLYLVKEVFNICIRVKQFFSAICAKITKSDIDFVNNILNQQERKLFFEMDIPTQKHCVKVASKCIELAKKHPVNIDIIAKTGLLHDIGKKFGDLGTIDRSLIVFFEKICPIFIKSLAKEGKGNILNNFRHALYVHYNHPKIGSDLLKSIKIDEKIIDIIRNHHNQEKEDDILELNLLRQSDNMY